MLEDLKEMLENHDWYFHMSDSGHYYRKGRIERERIERDRETHCGRFPCESFRALYNEMKPSDFFDKE